jgi:flagellar motor protein MotB
MDIRIIAGMAIFFVVGYIVGSSITRKKYEDKAISKEINKISIVEQDSYVPNVEPEPKETEEAEEQKEEEPAKEEQEKEEVNEETNSEETKEERKAEPIQNN